VRLHNPGQRKQTAIHPANEVYSYGEALRKQGASLSFAPLSRKQSSSGTLQMLGKLDDLSAILAERVESLILESRAVVQDINIALWEGSAPGGAVDSMQALR